MDRAPWTPSRLVAGAGVLQAAAGALIGLAAVMHPGGPHPPGAGEMADPSYAFWHGVGAAGYACLAASLAGMITVQVRATGSVGLADVVGYALAVVGAALRAGVLYADGFALGAFASVVPAVLDVNGPLHGAPFLAAPSAIAETALAAGLVTMGGAALHREILPRGAVVAMMAGGVLVGVPVQPASPVPAWCALVGGLSLATGAASLGRWMWQGGVRPSRLPPLPRGGRGRPQATWPPGPTVPPDPPARVVDRPAASLASPPDSPA